MLETSSVMRNAMRKKRPLALVLDALNRKARSGKRFITAGIMASAIDPAIGIPIALPGIALGLSEAAGRHSIKKYLLKNPGAARMFAEEFNGTEHEDFFEEILVQIEKNKRKQMIKKYSRMRGHRPASSK